MQALKSNRCLVHSVFQKVINLSAGDLFFSIGNAKIEEGPGTIIMNEAADFMEWGLKRGDIVFCENKKLILSGRFEIKMQEKNCFFINDLSKCKPYREEHLLLSIPLAERLTFIYGADGELYRCYFNMEEKTKTDQFFQIHFRRIKEAIKEKSEHVLVKELYSIVGLGRGLTPSGDDFIAGMLFIFSIFQKTDIMQYWDLVCFCKTKTNRISYEEIVQAYHGKSRRSQMQFLSAILQGDQTMIKNSVHGILRYGSTSGTDIMIGMLMAFKRIGFMMERKQMML